MLDIKFIIENKQSVEKKLASMGESLDFDLVEELFQERKKLILKTEEISSIRNNLRNEIEKIKSYAYKKNKLDIDEIKSLINFSGEYKSVKVLFIRQL